MAAIERPHAAHHRLLFGNRRDLRARHEVTATLEREGVESFSASFHDAFATLEKRCAEVAK